MPITRQRVDAAWAVSVWVLGLGERSRKVVSVQMTRRTWPLRYCTPWPWLQTDTQCRLPQGSVWTLCSVDSSSLLKICSCLLGAQERPLGPLLPQHPRTCLGDSTARVSYSLHLSPGSSRAASVSRSLSMSHPSPEAWAQRTLAK